MLTQEPRGSSFQRTRAFLSAFSQKVSAQKEDKRRVFLIRHLRLPLRRKGPATFVWQSGAP
jgi:hypothetical protein